MYRYSFDITDCNVGVQTKDDPRNVELFLFPDEDNMSVSSGSQTYADSQSSDDDLEAEFYVVNNEVGMGYPVGIF